MEKKMDKYCVHFKKIKNELNMMQKIMNIFFSSKQNEK